MSADNLIRIKKKPNGHYQVRHESVSSLFHALNNVEPTEDELLLNVVSDDEETYAKAYKRAIDFMNEVEQDGGEVEYGVVDNNWKK